MERPIMILGAMEDVELDIIKKNLKDVEIEKEKTCIFYRGSLLNKSVVLCSTNIGSINAAMATLLGILKYNPKMIIVQGIAGGHGTTIHAKDIVVATEIININTLETEKKTKGEGSNSLEWKLNNFIDDVENGIIIEKTNELLIETAKKVEYSQGNVFFRKNWKW